MHTPDFVEQQAERARRNGYEAAVTQFANDNRETEPVVGGPGVIGEPEQTIPEAMAAYDRDRAKFLRNVANPYSRGSF